MRGLPATKPATLVGPDDDVAIRQETDAWASRGGVKLAAALDAFAIDPAGLRCLDVGASTGGFTDVLLRRGASAVTALDVGYGQLLWRLRQDPRVTVADRTNFRVVAPELLGPPFDLVVVDVSFISVALLAGNLAAVGSTGTDYVILVKPQFEVGRDAVGRGGLVRDERKWSSAVRTVALSLHGAGLGFAAATPSPITGAAGNREFFLHLRAGDATPPDQVTIDGVVSA